jgi:hypothetical protein
MATTKAATNEREITILVRYFIKKDCPEKGLHAGDVVLYVRNDKGVCYYTTLRRNRAHSCTCASRKPCYHIKKLVQVENARHAASKVAKAVDEKTTRPTEDVAKAAIDEAEKIIKNTDVMKAPLNGNRGFSLLR